MVNQTNQRKLIWTLQSSFEKETNSSYLKSKFNFIHKPLINLNFNSNYKKIKSEIKKYQNIIITSPYAAEKTVNLINCLTHDIYAVGKKSNDIFIKSNFKVVKNFHVSQDMSNWIRQNSKDKFIHLCSDMSDSEIWPSNVDSFPFYFPTENKEIDKNFIKKTTNSIVVFGSPSGVKVWFDNQTHDNGNSFVCMGLTTANKIKDYTDKDVIYPPDSKLSTLIDLLNGKEKLYEK